MAEYVDREALIKELCNSCDGWCDKVDCDCVNCKSEHRCDPVVEIVDAPAADVVEVVRCKDCIHWGGVTFGNICRRWSAPLAGMKNCTQPDDFCSCGERKDGAV